MASLSRQSALAVVKQTAAGTFVTPQTADLLPISNLRTSFDPYTLENPEYIGSIHRQGPVVLGKSFSISFDVALRGPGAMPTADSFILGRLLQSLNMTENLVAAAIPAAPEAGTAGTTTGLTLGAGAAATAALYEGLLIDLPGQGGGLAPESLSAIIAYTAAKVATLAETLSATYGIGTYQIPKQAAYHMAESGSAPKLSLSAWLGQHRYDMLDGVPSQASLRLPVSSRGNAQLPVLSITYTGELNGHSDDSAQAVPQRGAIPLFKDGDMWISKKSFGGSSFDVDLGLTLDFPPNPNEADGAEPGEIVETLRKVSCNLNQVTKSYFDLIAAADAQAYHSFWAMFGSATGNVVSIIVPEARLSFPNFAPEGNFVQGSIDGIIDRGSKSVNIAFPIF